MYLLGVSAIVYQTLHDSINKGAVWWNWLDANGGGEVIGYKRWKRNR